MCHKSSCTVTKEDWGLTLDYTRTLLLPKKSSEKAHRLLLRLSNIQTVFGQQIWLHLQRKVQEKWTNFHVKGHGNMELNTSFEAWNSAEV